jgi:hypothetical protein
VKQSDQPAPEYERPEIEDYGTLEELTASQSKGHARDVPLGTPQPPFNIFSL